MMGNPQVLTGIKIKKVYYLYNELDEIE